MNDLQTLYGKHANDDPPVKVVISGHSLGGAMANFAFIDVRVTL